MPVPVTVVTGFLGAGKTTLVNRWLADVPRGDIAVIVNEHGAVGIDGALLEARVKTLVEIAGGCVCCSTQAELARALDELALSETPPKRILIETSGAASPAGVVHVVSGRAHLGGHVFDGILTVADATRIDTLAEHELAIEQLGYADIVVLSRIDQCSEEARTHATDVVGTYNGAAFAIGASRGEVEIPSLDALLDHRRADFPKVRPTLPRASHVYESIALVHDGDVDGERFADFIADDVASHASRLFRTKGILAVAGLEERMIIQGVAGLAEVTFGEPWGITPRTSRYVVVGYGLDRAALERGFAACVARVR